MKEVQKSRSQKGGEAIEMTIGFFVVAGVFIGVGYGCCKGIMWYGENVIPAAFENIGVGAKTVSGAFGEIDGAYKAGQARGFVNNGGKEAVEEVVTVIKKEVKKAPKPKGP